MRIGHCNSRCNLFNPEEQLTRVDQLVVGNPAADEEDEAHKEAQALQTHAAHPGLVNVDGRQKVAKVGNERIKQGPLKHLRTYGLHLSGSPT